VLAALGGGLGWIVASRRVNEPSPLEAARERTALRYRDAKIFDRKYVEGKLWLDPVLPLVAELGLELGRVLDAGAGRGQLGLCLLELGQVRTLRGFDLDARKIEVARQAAAGAASFDVAHLASAELSGFDTLLLVDVLHYLRSEHQDALLERASQALEPGGRILIRDTDAAQRRSGFVTRAAERLAKVTGWHRGDQALCFRPLAELVARLEALGLRCRVTDASRGTPFSNALIVAERPPSG
jgi:2-polyprenyl-3-methyl-5-hydroxy-6-metoxy-1,4-benzoquinol methylase